ncbi:MAG TPA: hypothetical protein PKJ37_09365 [Acidobacteriota bacterium]|jgi:hypothetical protein|nr:hypothetical protein [Acidobacteriota bacterium]HNT18083.1 hypothetical protein [Acidobacteriota bacterium]
MYEVLHEFIKGAWPPALFFILGIFFMNNFLVPFIHVRLTEKGVCLFALFGLLYLDCIPYEKICEVKTISYSQFYWPPRELRPMKYWVRHFVWFRRAVLLRIEGYDEKCVVFNSSNVERTINEIRNRIRNLSRVKEPS